MSPSACPSASRGIHLPSSRATQSHADLLGFHRARVVANHLEKRAGGAPRVQRSLGSGYHPAKQLSKDQENSRAAVVIARGLEMGAMRGH